MDEGIPRGASAGPNRRSRSTRARTAPPDRLALWAVFLALFFLVLAAATAHAATGGISTGGGATSSGDDAAFGTRVLRVGMSGTDVKILNGIVRSKSYASSVRLTTVFNGPTEGAVRQFQHAAGLADTGVVNETTASA